MKIIDNVYMIGGSNLSNPQDAAIYCLYDNDEAAMIDAGTGEGHDRVIKNLQKIGINNNQIKYLFLTHCHFDHVGGAYKLKGQLNCKVVAHELDAVYIEAGDPNVTASSWYGSFLQPCRIDVKVNKKHQIFKLGNLDINMYHTPGHSPGSAVYTVKINNQLVLFGQDIHGPLNDLLKSNRDDYIKSLEFLISLEADILCEGHFGVYYGKEEVKSFIESYL